MNPSELPDNAQDKKGELPEEYRRFLSEDDIVISIEDHGDELVPPQTLIDPVEIFCQLGDVQKPEDLGTHFITASGILTGRESGKTQGKFVVPFPRDFCYMMLALKDVYPFLPARGILHINKYIAMGEDLRREAEFGRDAHEVRDSATDIRAQELTSRLGIEWPYHGQIDVGGLVIKLIHWVCFNRPDGFAYLNTNYCGEDKKEHTVLDSLIFREQWMLNRLNANPEGLLEFHAAFPGSHPVQSMEDSPVSHIHKNGDLANLDKWVSSTEVLGDTYDALLCLAEIYEQIDQHKEVNNSYADLSEQAKKLRDQAKNIKQRIFDLWIPEENFFGMGYDRGESGELRVLDVPKAISAFILDTRIWEEGGENPEQAEKIQNLKETFIKRLFESDMLAAGGLRTLSSKSKRFDPGRYHLGSVWPFMSYRVAEGLRRQGYPHVARELDKRIVEIFEHFKMWPELIRGDLDDRLRISHLRVEVYNTTWKMNDKSCVISQTVQGWSVSAHIGALNRLQESLPPITDFERNILDNLAS